MKGYPSFREAKAHAKFISKTFNLKTTHGQEIVSYMYDCNDWSTLKDRCDNSEKFPDVEFTFLADADELLKFEQLIEPILPQLKSELESSQYVSGSLLERIVNKQITKISGNIISKIIFEAEEANESTFESISQTIGLCDDTFNHLLYCENNRYFNNTHLHPEHFQQKMYMYYDFNGNKKLDLRIREWDLVILKPSATLSLERMFSACSRKWFQDYMIGYLKYLVQQCRQAGYEGTVKIYKIQNVTFKSVFLNTYDGFKNKDIQLLFDELLSYNGKVIWHTNEQGEKVEYAIELKFAHTSTEWMSGGKSL
ncbi:MAG: hypothetical protein ACPGUD_05220 [Parashewanella sp.]